MKAQLFAVQARVSAADYASPEAFHAKIDALGAALAARRDPAVPALAVFPEEIGTFLGLAGEPAAQRARSTDLAMAQVATRHLGELVRVVARYRVLRPSVALLLARSAAARRVYMEAFSRLARERALTVVAGSLLSADNAHGDDVVDFRAASGRVYNVSYTFGPDGGVLATTRKVNLVPTIEDELGLARGDASALPVTETPVGRVGTLICYDGFAVPHTRDEPCFRPVAHELAARGAEILAQPSANPWPWDAPWPWREGRALLRREQWLSEGLWSILPSLEGVRWVVNPQLVGRVLDHGFDGRSYIFRRDPDGRCAIAAEARSTDEEEIVSCVTG